MSLGDNIVEIYYSGAWHDITADVQLRGGGIAIKRGRSSESSTVSASECDLSLNNGVSKVTPSVTGRYSPRNPNSDLYGLIGRNTPLRVRVDDGIDAYMRLWVDEDRIFCDDSAALSPSGNVDIRADIEPAAWVTGGSQALAGKYRTDANRSWAFWITSTGNLQLRTSSDGTAQTNWTSTVVVPFASGRGAVRATFETNDGSGNRRVTFYTAATMSGSWTQLGTAVTTAGTSSLFDSAAPLEVGDATGVVVGSSLIGRMYGFELRDGIAGTVVAGPTFDEELSTNAAGANEFTDAQGNVWEFAASGNLVNPNRRFTGEVSTWPQEWDTSGNDFWVPVQAGGALRRLARWNDSLQSTLRRQIPSIPGVVAYWPMEDPAGAQQFAAVPVGGKVDTGGALWGAADLASYSDFPCSLPLPVNTGPRWRFTPGGYTPTGEVQVRFLLHVESALTDATPLLNIYTTGTLYRTQLQYRTGSGLLTGTGRMRVICHDSDNNQVESTDIQWDNGIDGADIIMSIELENNGSAVDWHIRKLAIGETVGGVVNGSIASESVSAVSSITISPNDNLTGVAIGHLSIENAQTSFDDRRDAVQAYLGEYAHDRFSRLCQENDVLAVVVGRSEVRMGYQLPSTFLDLIDDVEAADLGYLYEPRETYGLAYRCRTSVHLQEPVLELGYDAADLSEFKPVEDDQAIKNAITVSRPGGSSKTVEQFTGPLSVEQPPDGVGRYTDSQEAGVMHDLALVDNADWRLALGTIDEPRYPALGFELARANFTSDAELTAGAMALDMGDRLTVDNPPDQIGPELVSQLALGFSETLTKFTRTFSVTCTPEAVHQISSWSDDDATDSTSGIERVDTDGSELWTGVDSDDTVLDVITTDGVWWSADPDDLPYDVMLGGERMTVTGATGPGQVLNRNPYFETDATDWTVTAGVTIARSTAQFHSGAASGLLSTVGTPVNWSASSTGVAGAPVTAWKGSAWVRTTASLDLRAVLVWMDSAGSALSTTNGTTTTVASGTWTRLKVSGIAPASTVLVGIRLQALNNPGAGSTCYADEIELRRTDLSGHEEPEFVGVGTGDSQNNASVTPGVPTGAARGDLVLIFCSIRTTAATVATPAGWSVITNFGGQTNVKVLGRIFDPDGTLTGTAWSTMPTVTFSGGSAGADTIAQSCAFRYVALTPVAETGQFNSADAQDIAVPALVVPYPGTPVMQVIAGRKNDDWTGVAPPANWTEINERVGTAGDDAGQEWAYLGRNAPASPDFGGATLVVTGGTAKPSAGAVIVLARSQRLVVTRSVNGIVKSHSAGASVSLADPKRWSY